MKTGCLKKDRKERFNLRRGWFVNAWRVVDEQGRDMVQPWANTKGEARATAKALGINLIETEPRERATDPARPQWRSAR